MEQIKEENKIIGLINLLESKKEELQGYITYNNSTQPEAHDNWSKLSNEEDWIEIEERNNTNKRTLYFAFGVTGLSFFAALLAGAITIPVVCIFLASLVGAVVTNLGIESTRVDNRYREIENARIIYDNLKTDKFEAEKILETIDFLLDILKQVTNEDEKVVAEYCKHVNIIYEEMLNTEIDCKKVEENSNNKKGLKVVNSRKKYKPSVKTLSLPVFVK